MFQFESEGMRKHLKDLKPETINDLIAMNALYRPGPMQFIPDYINRKHGKETVEYPHDDLKGILKPTHGIMVYQEQIMMVAQKMGGYSLGEADVLRRIMGKKKADLLPPEEKNLCGRRRSWVTAKQWPRMCSIRWRCLPATDLTSRTQRPIRW